MESDANIKDMNTSIITKCEAPVVDMVRSEVYILSNGHLQSVNVIRRMYQNIQFILDPELGLFVLSVDDEQALKKDSEFRYMVDILMRYANCTDIVTYVKILPDELEDRFRL